MEVLNDCCQIDHKDREILRRLADRVAELASRPVEVEKRELWYRHNGLEATRSLIFCDPENGWSEIIRQDRLECRSLQSRIWEFSLRKEVFWGDQIGDDRVILPIFDVSHRFIESDWGMRPIKIGGQAGGAYSLDPPLKSYDDLEKLHFPSITIDTKSTQRLFEFAQNIFGDILTVRLRTNSGVPISTGWTETELPPEVWWWSLGMTETLMQLRGLSQMMLDMIDQVDNLHRLMTFLRDGYLAKLEFLEQNDLLALNNEGNYVGSGGFGWTHELPQPDFNGRVRNCDMWGFAESQETVGISPQMFAEFILPYQIPLLERFGLNCYGCCEPLEKRWSLIQNIPRLRRVSVSPWSNIASMAEKLGDHYIFSMKARPSDLALPVFDEDRIRKDLRHALKLTRNCRVEIIMKDNHTIANDPRRVIRWVQIAREEVNNL